MPCYDSRADDDRAAEQQKLRQQLQEFRHNSEVASLLCEAMTFLRSQGQDNDAFCSENLLEWWTEHRRRDADRAGSA